MVFHFQISKGVRQLNLHVWTRNFRICQQGVPGQGTLQNNERIFQSQTSTSKKSKVHSGSEALCALLCHADYESFFKCINFSCLVGRSLGPYTWQERRVSRILQLVLSASPECEMNSGVCESTYPELISFSLHICLINLRLIRK